MAATDPGEKQWPAPMRTGAQAATAEYGFSSFLEPRFPPSKIAALVEELEQDGIAAQAVLAGTGLTRAAVADPFSLTSSMQFLTAARNALGLYDGTDLGVRLGQRLHVSSYGMFGYALLCSETLRHAFDTAVRYHRLANGMLEIRWVEEGHMASWLFPPLTALPLPDVDARLYQFLVDLQFVVHVTLTKDVMGTWCIPARAAIAGPEPPHAAVLAAALQCPVEFNQPGHALSYPLAWLSRAPQLANPITAAQVSSHCARLIEEFQWRSGMTQRVYHELTRMPGRFPDIDAIAQSLCISARTLRRKLLAEGTSYNQLFASVRKALAIDYLSTTMMSTDDIAAALDFSDVVSFRHAFKKWTGKTPNDWRQKR